MWQEKYRALNTITEKLHDLNQELLRSPAAAELREALTTLGDEYPVLQPQIELQFSFAGDDSSGATFRHSYGLEYAAGLGVVPFERGLEEGRFHAADLALLTALNQLSLDRQTRANAARQTDSEMDELLRAGQAPSDPHAQKALQESIAEERRRKVSKSREIWRAKYHEWLKSHELQHLTSGIG